MLLSAFDVAGLKINYQFSRMNKFERGLVATFYPDGSWLSVEGELIWVRCSAVRFDHAPATRAAIVGEGIPKLVQWAKSIEILDFRSTIRRERQNFVFPYPDLEN
ncbi:hypothetical protein [Sphingomonas lacusdianchii]|uniref:hypothetical protein n=1 Tax=Sphingomonas lacusdianchii TaxID=2917992 RepID=UPI001F5A8432|nr:hypothetical protein [Sphingomonas sp. JXJ CY 53]